MMTEEDIRQHAARMLLAKSEEDFIAAFTAYARDVVAREREPFEKIGSFVAGLLRPHVAWGSLELDGEAMRKIVELLFSQKLGADS